MDDNNSKEQIVKKSRWPVIQNFSKNINALAQKKIYDESFKVIGREKELDRIINNLAREDGTNILIIGSPGRGKRTLIYGLCQRILKKQVPKKMMSYQFEYLDAASLIAGTKYRGQFEERLKAISNELEKNEDLILVFDNLKIITNTGNSLSWQINLLVDFKRLIIIANNSEVKRLSEIENDMLSSFATIQLDQLDENVINEVLKKRQIHFGNYYNCQINNENLYKEITDISDIFLPHKSQPKKALDLLEELNSDANISRTNIQTDKTYKTNKIIIYKNNELSKINTKLKNIAINDYEYGVLLDQGKSLKKERDELYEQLDIIKKSEKFCITIDYMNSFCSKKFNKEVDEIVNRVKQDFSDNDLELNEELPKFERYQASSILNGDEIKIQRGTGFVLIPHNEKFDEIFDTIIKPSMLENGLTAIKASDIYQTGSILNQVWKQIRTAEVIIADVSGQNSNVIFELGLCFAIKRSPILITQEVKAIPFNIRSLRYIEYKDTAKGGRELSKKLTQTISGFLDSVRT